MLSRGKKKHTLVNLKIHNVRKFLIANGVLLQTLFLKIGFFYLVTQVNSHSNVNEITHWHTVATILYLLRKLFCFLLVEDFYVKIVNYL